MTVAEKGASAPKTKSARTNQRAILSAPVKHEGELPPKKSGGRKSLLAPIVEILQADPGSWYVIARGKKGTVSQTRSRFAKLCPEAEVDTRAVDAEISECYARFPAPKKDSK